MFEKKRGEHQVLNTLKLILTAPLNQSRKLQALTDWFCWQVGSRMVPGAVAVPFVNDAVLLAEPGMTGATGNIYLGLAEFDDMGFLLHFLQEDDLFLDVGANIGSFTVLASKSVGAHSIAIEALPYTYQKFFQNLRINDILDKVQALNIAAGDAEGSIHFTSGLDTMNHVVAEDNVNDIETCAVKVKRLDNILEGRVPNLIKIDVEGFETPVIEGALETLMNIKQQAVIMELNGCGQRYGFNDDTLHQKMIALGYCAVSYNPMNRVIRELEYSNHEGNTIYLKKSSRFEVEKKLMLSKPFKVKGQSV